MQSLMARLSRLRRSRRFVRMWHWEIKVGIRTVDGDRRLFFLNTSLENRKYKNIEQLVDIANYFGRPLRMFEWDDFGTNGHFEDMEVFVDPDAGQELVWVNDMLEQSFSPAPVIHTVLRI